MPPSGCELPAGGIEIQAYGHLMDQFWSPLTNQLEGPTAAVSTTVCASPSIARQHPRAGRPGKFSLGVRYTGDEVSPGGIDDTDGLEISRRLKSCGMVDFLNVVKGHIDTDAA